MPPLVGVRVPVGWGELGWCRSSDSGEETISESPSGSVAVESRVSIVLISFGE